ncbi:MAG: aminotransferase [Novosphingobium sp. 17-62-19]|uniref:aminotransferase n=1 Tax=Novosphingobium sp. 17-62-19 TaxID=1970406 RepID=UPI000BCFCDE2|nr:aminotransferase [Novosphingobium sp. 17-62-19]OZA21602.1 MAG: aminotransferase [Novosphingobium sp. 17-62-19]HQS97067.1 aminotransferase [Novosphingobium sp.]
MTQPRLHPIYAGMPVTIFEEMSGLSRQTGAINLGQGFPDGAPPPALLEALARASMERSHQYPPMAGIPELRRAVAAFYARTQALDLPPESVIVTSGATEAVASAILAVVQPGDEVLLFSPAYDAYAPLVRRAGGVPVFIALQPPLWRYDHAAIEAAISPRTRALVLNDPLNPTGTVASPSDLAMLAQLCVTHDLFAICDEVWENVRFDGQPHVSLLAQPGMKTRALKIGSAGKIFGATGWKVGWIVAAPEVAAVVGRAHQFLTFTTPPMLQWAVAEGLESPQIAQSCTARWAETRAVLIEALTCEGFALLPNAATWFTCIDLPASGIPLDDRTFALCAVHEAGVATIPLSALWEGSSAPTDIARLCHCKPAAMLVEAVERLARWRDGGA